MMIKSIKALLFLFLIISTATRAAQPLTVVPQDRLTKKDWGKRHEEKLVQAKAGNVELVMIGDSITHRTRREKKVSQASCSFSILKRIPGSNVISPQKTRRSLSVLTES